MKRCRLAVALVAVWLLAGPASAADDQAILLRVFLTDGTSLVSYGEPARVGDRVVFSMPTSASLTDPELQLVNLSSDHVDWDRTSRYAESVRSARYMMTQADVQYAMLTAEVGQALNDISQTTDPVRRLDIVERARRILADWPASHFNYKQAEINQMVATLDEAIVELRAAAGVHRFDLNFVTSTAPAASDREPILPPPTSREMVEQALIAARLADSSVERVSLTTVALAIVERDADVLPSDWRTEIRRSAKAAIADELATDRQYQTLTTRILGLADSRSRNADVRGLHRLLAEIQDRDGRLGARRPEAVNALVQTVEAKLDAARALQLARDRWALRQDDFTKYRDSVATPIERFNRLKPALEDIKALAGSSPWTLGAIQRGTTQVMTSMSEILPPDEFQAAHALLVSAVQMADSAAKIRREAALTGSISRAWDASAAAAGALMLGANARSEIQSLLRFPQLPR
jgi:hypothetical protein